MGSRMRRSSAPPTTWSPSASTAAPRRITSSAWSPRTVRDTSGPEGSSTTGTSGGPAAGGTTASTGPTPAKPEDKVEASSHVFRRRFIPHIISWQLRNIYSNFIIYYSLLHSLRYCTALTFIQQINLEVKLKK